MQETPLPYFIAQRWRFLIQETREFPYLWVDRDLSRLRPLTCLLPAPRISSHGCISAFFIWGEAPFLPLQTALPPNFAMPFAKTPIELGRFGRLDPRIFPFVPSSSEKRLAQNNLHDEVAKKICLFGAACLKII